MSIDKSPFCLLRGHVPDRSKPLAAVWAAEYQLLNGKAPSRMAFERRAAHLARELRRAGARRGRQLRHSKVPAGNGTTDRRAVSRFVSDGLHEIVDVMNFTQQSARLTLDLQVDAELADTA